MRLTPEQEQTIRMALHSAIQEADRYLKDSAIHEANKAYWTAKRDAAQDVLDTLYACRHVEVVAWAEQPEAVTPQ